MEHARARVLPSVSREVSRGQREEREIGELKAVLMTRSETLRARPAARRRSYVSVKPKGRAFVFLIRRSFRK